MWAVFQQLISTAPFFLSWHWKKKKLIQILIKLIYIDRNRRYMWNLYWELASSCMFGGEAGDQFFSPTVASRKPLFAYCQLAAQLRPGRGKTQYNFLSSTEQSTPTLSLQPNNGLINQPGNTNGNIKSLTLVFGPVVCWWLTRLGNWERIENLTWYNF